MIMKKGRTEIVSTGALSRRNELISMVIIGFLFFIFGFTTYINAILIPYFKISCQLNTTQSLLVAFSFYIAYFVMAVPAAKLLENVGFKKGIMIGFWIMALGALIFIPAALTRTYGIFLLGLFTIGTGLAILQPAANTYITLIGPAARAAQRFSIMGVCNKGAGIIAPLFLAALILKPTDSELFKQLPLMDEIARNAALDDLIQRVIVPYACMAAVLFGFGLMIRYSILAEINSNSESLGVNDENSAKSSVIQFPHLVLGAIAIFVHVGSQVTGINTIIGYAQYLNMPLLEAKVFPSYVLGVTMLGYLSGIVLIPKFINHLNVLRVCTSLAIILTISFFMVNVKVTFLGHTSELSIWFLVMLGLSNSLMWSAIWPLALNGLGRFTKVGGSILIMGLCGSAIVPIIYGNFADHYNPHEAYWVLLPCYIYLLYYALHGYRLRSWTIKI